ncbi:hypothetical protein HMI55_007026 [Coelomomyces lativittatus]|nr:hypothetical protein HMI56_002528 [Coelomomyces lativittatus]KAJ1510347.1 hypothetical protein HMI55_007026 [Coelomomyces lativittatus]
MLKSTLPFTIDLKHLNALLTPSTSTSTSTSTTLVDAFTPLFSSTPLHPDLNARSSPPLDPNPTPIPLNPSCKASVSDHDPPEKKEKKSPLFVHPEESSSPPFPTPPPWPPAPSAPSSSSLPLPVSSINDPVLSVDAWLDVFLENEPKT